METLPRELVTESPAPLVVALDLSRSAREWSAPLLRTVRRVVGGMRNGTVEVSVCAAGDYRCHLLQVLGFQAPGKALARTVGGLHRCGLDKSFEFALYYYARHCRMPEARKGTFLIFGNEPFRDAVSAAHIRRWIGDPVERHPHTLDVLAELRERFRVVMNYLVRNVYDQEMIAWEAALGRGNVFEARDERTLLAHFRAQVEGLGGA